MRAIHCTSLTRIPPVMSFVRWPDYPHSTYPFLTPSTTFGLFFANPSQSHFSRLKTPPHLPIEPPQSVTMYRASSPDDPRISWIAVFEPRSTSRTSLLSQFEVSIITTLSPASSLVPTNGLLSQAQP